MPAKIWTRTSEGGVEAQVVSRGRPTGVPEHFVIADRLDERIDKTLDEAVDLAGRLGHPDFPVPFTRAWAIGRALLDSEILVDPALAGEPTRFIWQVMAHKARAEVRSDGTEEIRWNRVRPNTRSTSGPARDAGGRPDYWEMCAWLAEQNYGDAAVTFGGSIRNVGQLMDRRLLRPLIVRQALHKWLTGLPEEDARRITRPRAFAQMVKQLTRRWPARGPRRGPLPLRYSIDDLVAEIDRVVDRVAILAASSTPR